MKVSSHYMFALAFFHFALNVHGAPTASSSAASPTPTLPYPAGNAAELATKGNRVAAGTGINLPTEAKDAVGGVGQGQKTTAHRRAFPAPSDDNYVRKSVARRGGLPVNIMQGNADGATGASAIPVQNYQNDVSRLPVAGDFAPKADSTETAA